MRTLFIVFIFTLIYLSYFSNKESFSSTTVNPNKNDNITILWDSNTLIIYYYPIIPVIKTEKVPIKLINTDNNNVMKDNMTRINNYYIFRYYDLKLDNTYILEIIIDNKLTMTTPFTLTNTAIDDLGKNNNGIVHYVKCNEDGSYNFTADKCNWNNSMSPDEMCEENTSDTLMNTLNDYNNVYNIFIK